MSSYQSGPTPLASIPPHTFEPVAATKLVPPRPARRPLARDALLARLQEARHRRCVVLQGPAGCGKTSVLVSWRQALVSLGFEVAWLSLAEEDNDPGRFFDCLLASIGLVDAQIARKAANLIGDGSDASRVEHWVVTLIEAIASQPRDLVLVLDDVHHIQEERIWQALQWLLDYAPPHLHLVLCSRSALSLSLARLHSQGQVTMFDLRDLRFSPEESEAYLREQLGEISPRDARRLHELADGWVAGLQLFALDIKAKQGAAFSPTALRDASAFAEYFEREVLQKLSDDDQTLLSRVAICSRFCAALCATLVGQPRAVARMTTQLVRLDTSNLFIIQVSGHEHESWYRLHPLLREVLLARVAAMPVVEQQALHATASRWFEQRDQVEEAVRHAVLAGEASAAADAIEARASELLTRGGLGQLTSLLRLLPPEQVESRFALQLMQAHISLRARRLDEAAQAIGRLARQAAHLGQRERYAVTVLRGGMALMQDDICAASVLLPELQQEPADADDFLLTSRGNVMGWIHMHRGEHERAREVLADSTLRGGAMVSGLVGRCLSGLSLSMEGKILQAEPVFRQVLNEAEQLGGEYVGAAHMAAVLLSETFYELNEIDSVSDLLEKRIEQLEAISVPDAVLRALLMLALSNRVAGRRLEAAANLDRLEDYAVRHGLDRLLAIALAVRSRWQLQEGEIDKAEATVARVRKLSMEVAGRGSVWEIHVCAQLADSGLCLHRHDYDGAMARLRPLLDSVELASRGRHVAIVLIQCAVAEHGRGNARASQEHIREALRYGQRFGLVRSLIDAATNGMRLVRTLLDEQALDPVLAFYGRRLLEAAGRWRVRDVAPVAAMRRSAPIRTLSERETEVLKLIARAMSNKMVARTLSVSPETVKWHLKNIYIKLGVSGRDEAVALLRDLDADAPDGGAARPR
ncbi:putative ATP-dependent transcriptional regulator, LuxR-family [Cupriavidus taiwanensis]|uniref:LuxR C-terminal-related transcriptional regulator n=1 Tax=Cupriavidus taiwanensis TaxID=164546 RepID=UPI000E138C9A|nr:LuxR C-terminal-related transcriptional regulator [Cupriavidus taiwanensis]SPA39651.1 putative ATP-dependent transcriptional regulator, LuxR-family [Cupriavidus taiwanensis]